MKKGIFKKTVVDKDQFQSEGRQRARRSSTWFFVQGFDGGTSFCVTAGSERFGIWECGGVSGSF